MENARFTSMNSDFDTVAINISAIQVTTAVQYSQFIFEVIYYDYYLFEDCCSSIQNLKLDNAELSGKISILD